MDVDIYLSESASFTRSLLVGRYSRWLVFILLGLPWTILTSLLVSRNIFDGTTIHWSLIPWTESALLIIAGVLCNLVLSGYIVRLFSGGKTPPEFTGWEWLALDGIKFHVIPLTWMLVPILLGLAEYHLVSSGFTGSWPGLVLIVAVLIIELLVVLFAVKYAIIGLVRFSRTGSVKEAFDLVAIKETYDRIGIINYYLGLVVIVSVFLLITAVLNLFALVPLVGPFITLALDPPLTVFCARFIAHFCDEDTYEVQQIKRTLPLRALVQEFLTWSVVLAVLLILCFTPVVIVSGVIGKFLV